MSRKKPGCLARLLAAVALVILGAWAIKSCGDSDSPTRPPATAAAGERAAAVTAMREVLQPWLRREIDLDPSRPVRLASIGFNAAQECYEVVLDLRFDPRRLADPEKEIETWATSVAMLLGSRARPHDLLVFVWTYGSADEVIAYGHARYNGSEESWTFQRGPGWELLQK